MSKITKKDIKELKARLVEKIRAFEREIDGIEGQIAGLNLALASLTKVEEK